MSDTCRKEAREAKKKYKTLMSASDEHMAALDAAGVDWLKLWALAQAIIQAIINSGVLPKPTP